MNRFPIIFLLLFCTCLGITALAQKNNKPIHVELELKNKRDRYEVVSLGRNGIVIFMETDTKNQNNDILWEVKKYDSKLNLSWSKMVPVRYYLDFKNYDKDSSRLYLYFSQSGSNYISSKGYYDIVSIDLTNGNSKHIVGALERTHTFTSFKTGNGVAYLAGWMHPTTLQNIADVFLTLTIIPKIIGIHATNIVATMYEIDLKSGVRKLASKPVLGDSKVVDLTVEPNNVNFLIKQKWKRNDILTIEKTDSGLSKPSSISIISTNPKNKLASGKLIHINDHKNMMIGTYIRSKRPVNPDNVYLTDVANGIYTTSISNGKQDSIRFYNFSKFTNFFNYVDEKEMGKIQRRIKKTESKGDTVFFTYKLLMHPIVVHDGNYIMVAEAYYPEYHTEYYTTFAYGMAQAHPHEVFDGYRYTHTIVLAFDAYGKMLWDNTFEMNDVLSFNLKERVTLLFEDKDLLLVYANDNSIKFKVISGNKVVDSKESITIGEAMGKEESSNLSEKVKQEKEGLKQSNNTTINIWYDEFFLLTGYQNDRDSDSKKNVFFMNKIGFR